MTPSYRELSIVYSGHPWKQLAQWYERLYAAAATVSGASVLVDSSKHAALAYCLRFAPSIDLRVVHVVRDSRGVAYSWTKTVTRPETDGLEEMTRYSPSRSALLWNALLFTLGAVKTLCGTTVSMTRSHRSLLL